VSVVSGVERARGPTRGAVDTQALAVAGLSLLVLGLHISQLHQSLYGDEVLAYREIAGRSLVATIRIVSHGVESSPPLFFVLAWISSKLGDPTVTIRLPSLIAGVATVPLVFLIGRATAGPRAGLMGAAVFALSPFATYYGIEARPYALLACLVALSTFALLEAVRTHARRWWLLYSLAAAAAAYTHYTAIFVLAVQGAWSLWASRERLREPLAAGALAVALYLPWLPHLHGSALALYGALEPLSFVNVSADLLRVIPGYPYAPLSAIPTVPGLIALWAAMFAGVAALLWSRAPGNRATDRAEVAHGRLLIVSLALATPAGLLLYSLLEVDIWDARDLFASAPAMAATAGMLLSAPPRWWARAACVAVALAALALGTARAISPRWARPPFRAAAAYIDRHGGAGDPVVLYPFFLNLSDAVAVELSGRHPVIDGIPRRWPPPPRGGSTWLIYETGLERDHIGIPRPPGLRLTVVRRYGGLAPFELLRYTRS
jgi:hypothetical protein